MYKMSPVLAYEKARSRPKTTGVVSRGPAADQRGSHWLKKEHSEHQ